MTTVSLSRAHKLVERLTRQIDVNETRILGLSGTVRVQIPEQAEKAEINLKQLIELSGKNQALYDDLLSLRTEIAKANEKAGIGVLLAEHKVTLRKLNALKLLNEKVRSASDAIEAKDVQSYFSRPADTFSRGADVRVVGSDYASAIEKEEITIRLNLERISDEINDLNAKMKVAIKVSDEGREVIGL